MESGVVGTGWDLPDEVRDRTEFHWFHVPPGGELLLGCLSPCPLWYVGHYHKGRMRACRGDECPLCAMGTGRQIRWVLSCMDLRTHRVGVLEVGDGPGRVIKDSCGGNGRLRGLILAIRHTSKAKQSRLEVEVIHEPPPPRLMSTEALDLKEVLFSTWDRAAHCDRV